MTVWVRAVKELYCPSSHHKVCLETDQQRGNATMKCALPVNLYHMPPKGAIVPFHYPHQVGNKIFFYVFERRKRKKKQVLDVGATLPLCFPIKPQIILTLIDVMQHTFTVHIYWFILLLQCFDTLTARFL